jgi:hypothetical protein
MASIFELVTAAAITAYWDALEQDRAPYLGEELFDEQQKLGLDLKWIRGSAGLPVVLLPSAYDVKSKKRDRIGFTKVQTEMPFFKESTYIDEELRQQLNMVLETGNQAYIDAVMNRVFADEIQLLEGARAQRERMRMMLLTTGAISISANGQDYDYDYGMKAENKVTVTKDWSIATEEADIVSDIRTWQDTIEDATGVRPRRAVVSRKTFGYIMNNILIRNANHGNNSAAPVSEEKVKTYLLNELDLTIVVYTKRYKDEGKVATAFVPDDLFVLFPEGKLGTGWFGTTPEQSDLMSGAAANVSIVDTGVAVTTTKETDPVQVETKVSMIYLPSFEAIDQVLIAQVVPDKDGV